MRARALFGDGYGQNADLIVIRKRQRPRARGGVDRIGEQVRGAVQRVGAVGVVTMRGEPGDVGMLDEAGRDACQFAEGLDACARTLIGSAGKRWKLAGFRLPCSVVPLADIPRSEER